MGGRVYARIRREGMIMARWEFNEHKSEWENARALVEYMGYKPQRLSMDGLIANILMHYDGACEDEDQDVSIKDYLIDGIWMGKEGRLSNFDYE